MSACEWIIKALLDLLYNQTTRVDMFESIGAFPLRGTTRLGTVQNGTAWLSSALFAFPLQFITALEWAGLFTCRYSCAASTAVTPEKVFNSTSLHHALAGSAPRLSTRGQSVLPQQTTKQPFLVVKRKVRSFKTVVFDPSLTVLI